MVSGLRDGRKSKALATIRDLADTLEDRSAERMRWYRKRKREAVKLPRSGIHYVQVPLHVTEVDTLVRMGWLKEEDRHDPQWLQGAVMSIVYQVLEDPACSAVVRGWRRRAR
jgi:hypothetical protein